MSVCILVIFQGILLMFIWFAEIGYLNFCRTINIKSWQKYVPLMLVSRKFGHIFGLVVMFV